MTGAAAALSVATSLAVLKPKTWGDGGQYANHTDLWYIYLLVL